MGMHYAFHSTPAHLIRGKFQTCKHAQAKLFMICPENRLLLSSEFSYNLKISVSFGGILQNQTSKTFYSNSRVVTFVDRRTGRRTNVPRL
jgi:hypothetical protein